MVKTSSMDNLSRPWTLAAPGVATSFENARISGEHSLSVVITSTATSLSPGPSPSRQVTMQFIFTEDKQHRPTAALHDCSCPQNCRGISKSQQGRCNCLGRRLLR